MLLRPGDTCWRVERADRLGLFIDMEEYFLAAREAMNAARRSIHLLNWAFEPQTLFEPDDRGDGPHSGRFGPFLRDLARARPQVDVRILCWRSALPVAASQHFFPHAAKTCFRRSPVKFLLDGKLPLGACHHQKALIVDDRVAFCGGGDIGPDRWDTVRHLDDDDRRQKSPRAGEDYESRHELMGLVDGAAARALGDLFRARWLNATGETMAAPSAVSPPESAPSQDPALHDPWPACVPVAATQASVGLARTRAAWRRNGELRENERLHLAAIAAARRTIYMENQYFTAPVMADALAARLAEPDGPEVVLLSTLHSPSWFDQATMDKTRIAFFEQLKAADAGGRLRFFCPVTEQGKFIIVHAKLTIVDDALLRIGSANLNNRSMGFDTECDLVIEAEGSADAAATARAIAHYRTELLAHWLHQPGAAVDAAIAAAGGRVGPAIAALDRPAKPFLPPLADAPVGPLAGLIGRYHLGDPVGAKDAWAPWTRRAAVDRDKAAMGRLGQASPG